MLFYNKNIKNEIGVNSVKKSNRGHKTTDNLIFTR